MHNHNWEAAVEPNVEPVTMHAPGVWVAHEHHGVGEIVAVAANRIKIRFAGEMVTIVGDAFGLFGFVMLGRRLH